MNQNNAVSVSSLPKVLIVGAGPVGLAAAAFLKRQLVSFDIIEDRSGPVKDSRALGIHARTLEFMEILGIEEEFLRRGLPTRYMSFHRYGKKLFSFDFSKIDVLTKYSSYLILPQSQTEDILSNHLSQNGVNILWGHRLSNFIQYEDKVSVEIDSGRGSSYTKDYSYVIAADGASSTVRHMLNIEFRGETYPTEFLLSEVEIPGDKIDRNATHVYMGEKSTIAVIPQPNGCYRIVGPNFEQNKESEQKNNISSVTFEQFNTFLSKNGLLKNMEMVNPSRLLSYKMHKRVASSFRSGRVFLAGDAAHIHSPAGGQGMNTGIHDAVNLTWKISQVIRGISKDSLLDTYQTERMSFAKQVVSSTDKAMQKVMSRSLKSYFLFDLMAPVLMRFWQPRSIIASMAQVSGGYPDFEYVKKGIDELKGLRIHDNLIHGEEKLHTFLGRSNYVILLSGDPHTTSKFESVFSEIGVHKKDVVIKRLCYPFKKNELSEPWFGAILCRPDGYIAATFSVNESDVFKEYLNSTLLVENQYV